MEIMNTEKKDQDGYSNMSLKSVLEILEDHFLLPSIQREFCWNKDAIEFLFKSVVQGYPIGNFIFWKTKGKIINDPNSPQAFYHFFRDYNRNWKRKTINEQFNPSENIKVENENKDYYVVIDGQQRLTSFNIAFNGSFSDFKGGRGHSRNEVKDDQKYKLYYSLTYAKEYEDYKKRLENSDDDSQNRIPEPPLFEFKIADKDYPDHYPIHGFLDHASFDEIAEDLKNKGYDKASRPYKDLKTLYDRVNSSDENSLIHYYKITDKENSSETFTEAFNIFVAVNSGGRALSKSDLLFSTLVNKWPNSKEGRDCIEDFLRNEMNAKRYVFSRDYLLRLCLVLTDSNIIFNIFSMNQAATNNVYGEWKNIKEAINKTIKLLDELDIEEDSLASKNVLSPLIYYFYKGGKTPEGNDLIYRDKIRQYIYVATIKHLFSSSSTTVLNSTRAKLKEVGFCKNNVFSLDIFQNIKGFFITEKEIDTWLDTLVKGDKDTFLLLSFIQKNRHYDGKRFDVDHCHPWSRFEKGDCPNEEWKTMRNKLPNLQLLLPEGNSSKSDTPLEEYCKTKELFLRPDNVSLKFEDFEDFYKARKKMMKEELCRIFMVQYLHD